MEKKMIKIVNNSKFSDISQNLRFDCRYYYLGEILNLTLSKFNVKPLSSFTHSIRKGIFDLNSRYYQKIGYPFIRISNLMSYTIDEKGLVYISTFHHKKEHNTILYPNDLALSKIGKYLGKIAQIPLRYCEANISQNIIGVRFNCNDDLKRYIFLYLTTPLAINQIIRVSKQHNQNKLTLPDIRNLRIPLLTTSKIKYYANIVRQLSILEDQSYKLLKQAQELFIKKLNINFKQVKKLFSFSTSLKDIKEESFFTPQFSNPLYNKTLELIKKKYKTKKLSEIVDDFKGDEVGSENYNLYQDKIDTDVPFIRTSDIVNNEIDNYPDFFISDDIYVKLDQGIKENDIIFSKDGSIGNCALITKNDKVIISSGFSILRVKEDCELSPFYVFLALSIEEIGGYQAKKRTVVAATIPHLRPTNLLKIEIPILPKEDMAKITSIVKKAFKKKAERKKKLEDVKIELEKEFEFNQHK